ncbi:Protein of unknown function, partial [Gryllus bimaculatus]
EAVAASPALGPALLRVDVHRFAAGSLLVFFRLTLDRRKVGVPAGGAGAGQVEEAAAAALAAEEALRREATAARPRAFRRVPLDPAAIFVGRQVVLRLRPLQRGTHRPTTGLASTAESPKT